ncbi:hypothetical protein V6N13_104773 [Hibiscus sabdariffa]
MERVMVADMVDAAGNWDWRKFQDLLPSTVLFRIVAKMGPMAGGGGDLRNSIAFDTPMEDNRPILDQCRHLWDIASRALQRVNGAVIGSISRDSNAAVGAMARLARIGDFDQVDFVAPPASLHPLLLRDSLHASTPNYWLQITQ